MNAIISMAFGDGYQRLSKFTYPSISRYAQKIGAVFVELTERKFECVTYEKFQLENQLNIYDRIIWIDPDCYVKESCPNLFDAIPRTHFGAHDEYPNHPGGFEHIHAGRIELGHPSAPVENYFNTGVMVLSQSHRKLLVRPAIQIKATFTEQTHINIRLTLNKISVAKLPWTFNCMGLHHHESEPAHIIHFSESSIEQRIRGVKRLMAGKPIIPWWNRII